MSDWVAGSERMKWLAGASMATWLASVLCALFAPVGASELMTASAVLMICSFSISGPLGVWAGLHLARRSWLRTAWTAIGVGIAIDITAVVVVVVKNLLFHPNQNPFMGTYVVTATGLPLVAAGLYFAGFCLRKIPDLKRAIGRALVLPVGVYLLFLFALIGPGPAMPFSLSRADYVGIAGLTADVFLVFLPAVFCVAATLQLPNAHRARSWMWVAIGGLMWAMSDVVFPLVDLHYGQGYPLLLWALGVHLVAMGSSLAVDFERAESRMQLPLAHLAEQTAPHVIAAESQTDR